MLHIFSIGFKFDEHGGRSFIQSWVCCHAMVFRFIMVKFSNLKRCPTTHGSLENTSLVEPLVYSLSRTEPNLSSIKIEGLLIWKYKWGPISLLILLREFVTLFHMLRGHEGDLLGRSKFSPNFFLIISQCPRWDVDIEVGVTNPTNFSLSNFFFPNRKRLSAGNRFFEILVVRGFGVFEDEGDSVWSF